MPRKGRDHHNATLTDNAVRLARKWRREGDTFKAIGRRLGVHPHTARNAVHGITWKHVAKD